MQRVIHDNRDRLICAQNNIGMLQIKILDLRNCQARLVAAMAAAAGPERPFGARTRDSGSKDESNIGKSDLHFAEEFTFWSPRTT
jgi:hypothetical protein